MRAILATILLCTAFGFNQAQAEPSAETIARGKALTEAAEVNGPPVNAALRSSGLPPTAWRMTHPRLTAWEMVVALSRIPCSTCHCIDRPSVASYSL